MTIESLPDEVLFLVTREVLRDKQWTRIAGSYMAVSRRLRNSAIECLERVIYPQLKALSWAVLDSSLPLHLQCRSYRKKEPERRIPSQLGWEKPIHRSTRLALLHLSSGGTKYEANFNKLIKDLEWDYPFADEPSSEGLTALVLVFSRLPQVLPQLSVAGKLVELVTMLLAAKADPNRYYRRSGLLPLRELAKVEPHDAAEITLVKTLARLLISAGADPYFRPPNPPKDYLSPYALAKRCAPILFKELESLGFGCQTP